VKTQKLLAVAVISLLMFLFSFASTGYAQKLGYVNSQKILTTFKEALDAQEKLDKINQEWEAEGREMQKQFQELNEQLESQSLLLSEERKQEKQQEIQSLYLKIQQFSAEKWGQNGEFFKEQEKLMEPVIKKINDVIKQLGEEDGFDYIFDTVNANIVYANPSQPDLTDLVLEELEKGVESTQSQSGR
jgi:outer membrane protein